jgi:hypothetical protein
MVNFDLSMGDFLDRLSIAKIKKDKGKLDSIGNFWSALGSVDILIFSGQFARLLQINTDLWHAEDEIRDELSVTLSIEDHECDLEVIRKVYNLSRKIVELNDSRARVKKEIDLLAGDAPDAKVYAGKVSYDI